MDIVCGWLSSEQQQAIAEFAEQQTMKSVPRWLGTFQFKCYYNRSYERLSIYPIIEQMAGLLPAQSFNTVFLQKYIEGTEVFAHRDPKNNLDYTLIGVAGSFEGAHTYQDGKEAGRLMPGDVGVLPCTIKGVQGPRHYVTPVTSGTRYALILNTIE